MTRRIADLRNLGPKTAAMLGEIGVGTEAELRALGAVECYCRLRFAFGRQVSLNALHAMEAALLNIDWRALDAQTKDRLRREVAARTEPL